MNYFMKTNSELIINIQPKNLEALKGEKLDGLNLEDRIFFDTIGVVFLQKDLVFGVLVDKNIVFVFGHFDRNNMVFSHGSIL